MTLGMPSWIPKRTYDEPPTWKSGIETMRLVAGLEAPAVVGVDACAATMLAWVSMTPLGRPVVPEEYITRQTSSGSTSAGAVDGSEAASQASYSSPSPPSGVTSMILLDAVSRSRIFSTSGISSVPTTSTLAPLSLTA